MQVTRVILWSVSTGIGSLPLFTFHDSPVTFRFSTGSIFRIGFKPSHIKMTDILTQSAEDTH